MFSAGQTLFDDLIGKPYLECGKCYGLCRIAAGRMGIDLPHWQDVAQSQVAAQIEKARPLFTPVKNPQPGDLVYVVNFGAPPHVGIVIEPNVMLQATRRHNCHRMRLDHPWIRGRIEGFYRYDADRK
jgi:cell wall-associated NlpC family hydrolase